MLLKHDIAWAFAFAFDRAGNSIAARIAMIAITTNNSIKVKARNSRWVGFRREVRILQAGMM